MGRLCINARPQEGGRLEAMEKEAEAGSHPRLKLLALIVEGAHRRQVGLGLVLEKRVVEHLPCRRTQARPVIRHAALCFSYRACCDADA